MKSMLLVYAVGLRKSRISGIMVSLKVFFRMERGSASTNKLSAGGFGCSSGLL